MSNEKDALSLTEGDLEELFKLSSKKLVGRVLKRFEIHDNIPVLKSEIKELLYEGFRDLQELVIANGKGLHLTQFHFISKPKGDSHT